MGQENSVVDSDTPPETLSERSLSAVAELILSGRARRIVVMTGAGISTAAGSKYKVSTVHDSRRGAQFQTDTDPASSYRDMLHHLPKPNDADQVRSLVPDFRSPNTGLYANLSRLNLPYAEAVFDIGYFREHPEPFYVLAKELYPGKYHPTISHVFIALLSEKGLLHQLFTQNIDCLERRAGVPEQLIVEAHGSFATQRCVDCSIEYPDDKMKEYVEKGEVPRCGDCEGLVKPDIVFFGEALPQVFRDRQHYPDAADLALIMGTSLSVQPFASLPSMVRPETPRVLFNLERVGGIGSRADDVLELGDCDAGVRKLAKELGWLDELEATWREVVGHKEAERQLSASRSRAPIDEDELERLVDRVGEALKFEDGDEGETTSVGQVEGDHEEAAAAHKEPAKEAPVKEETPVPEPSTNASPAVADLKDTKAADTNPVEESKINAPAVAPTLEVATEQKQTENSTATGQSTS